MRHSASALVVSTAAAALLWAGLSTTAYAADPGVYQVSDDACSNVATQPQGDCACEEQPSALSAAFDRFVHPGECDSRWSFSADGIGLQRANTRGQVLFEGVAAIAAAPPVLNADHLDSPVALAFQLDAIRHGPCGWDVELGYFQVDGWIANSDVPGTSVMVTNADGTGVVVSGGHARYASALRLAELNVRRQWAEGFTLLVGFRTGELDEAYSATGAELTPIPLGPVSLETRTFNHLYGLQIGGDWEFYNMGGPLRISALCKSGIYGNSASQTSHRIDTGNEILEAGRNQATFMGEAGALATYDITCHLALRASFEAVWLEGVALAPEQINVNSFGAAGGAGIDTSGGLFYYGGGLGMEVRF